MTRHSPPAPKWTATDARRNRAGRNRTATVRKRRSPIAFLCGVASRRGPAHGRLPALLLLVLAGCGGDRLRHFDAHRSAAGRNTAATRVDAPPLAATEAARDPIAAPDAQPPGDVLQINEDTITVEDVLGPVRAELARKSAEMTPTAYREYLVERIQNQVRDKTREVLLYQEASRRLEDAENEMIDKFTDQRIRDIVQEQHDGRHVRWERAMAERGLTPEEAREKVRRELIIIRHLQLTVAPRIQEPTRRELMQFFEQQKAELTEPERREMFLIDVPKGEDPSAARATIDRALAELRGGANFEEVARAHSGGVQAANGGGWGIIGRDSLRPRWQPAVDALFRLPPGGTSGVVETADAYFVVRVGTIEAHQEPGFAEIQLALRKSYRDRAFNLLVEELVGRLLKQANIRPADPGRFLQACLDASLKPAIATVHGGS